MTTHGRSSWFGHGRTSPRRRVRSATGPAILVLGAAAALASATGCHQSPSAITIENPFGGGTVAKGRWSGTFGFDWALPLEIVVPSGDLDVRVVADGSMDLAEVNASYHMVAGDRVTAEDRLREASVRAPAPGDTGRTRLDLGLTEPLSTRDRVDLEIRLPAGVPLLLQTGRGSITVRGGDGSLRAMTGRGDIRIEDHAGPINVHSEDGNVILEGVGGRVTARADEGSIEARIDGGSEAVVELDAAEAIEVISESPLVDAVLESASGEVRVRVRGG